MFFSFFLDFFVFVVVFVCLFQMLECLKGVHSCGYLHRDVKPANFVRRKKNGKDFVIIDFGEALPFVGSGRVDAARGGGSRDGGGVGVVVLVYVAVGGGVGVGA